MFAKWQFAVDDLVEACEALNVDTTRPVDVGDRAQVRVDLWEEQVEVISSQCTSSFDPLDSHSTKFQALMKQRSRARQSTSDALEDAEPDDYDSLTVEYEMEAGGWERRRVRDSLRALVPPTSMLSAHAALVSVVEDAADAMAIGEQAVEDDNFCCINCADSFRDTSGWQSFSAASANLTSRFADAESFVERGPRRSPRRRRRSGPLPDARRAISQHHRSPGAVPCSWPPAASAEGVRRP